MGLKRTFSKKWVIATSSVVGTLAVATAVAAPIAIYIKDKGEQAVSDLGVDIAPSSRSAVDSGTYKDKTKKLRVVALGDSVTAGYTTLPTVGADGLPIFARDNLSYSDYFSYILSKKGDASVQKIDNERLESYDNLAVSGATASDLVNTLTNRSTATLVTNANVVMLSIGANDILKAFNMFGLPYSSISKLLTGETGKGGSQAREKIGFTSGIDQKLSNNLDATMLTRIGAIFNNHPEQIFGIDKATFENALHNAAGEILRLVSNIHKLSPTAEIVFCEYQFPFNRWMHGNVNISDVPSKEFTDLGYGTNTLRSTFDYIMGRVRDKVTENFGVVKWYSLQKAQDDLINSLVKNQEVSSKEEGLALFQPDLADIHPSEYSHALIGQKIYNDLFSSRLGEKTLDNKFPVVKATVKASSANPNFFAAFLGFLLKNNGTSPDVNFFAKIFNVPLTDVQSLVPLKEFMTALFDLVQAKDATEQATKLLALIPKIDAFIERNIFANQSMYDTYTTAGNFTPVAKEILSVNKYSTANTIMSIILLEAEISHVTATYLSVAKKLLATFTAQPTELDAFLTLNGTTSAQFNTLKPEDKVTTLYSFVTKIYDGLTTLPSTSEVTTWTNPKVTAATLQIFKDAFPELQKAVVYARAVANNFPGLTKKPGITRDLVWSDLRRATTGILTLPDPENAGLMSRLV